jgi:eukaryotic-like serine/threonine-protein kinase
VRDLEEVLTYEAARTGEAEGQATVVLEQLPGRRRDRRTLVKRIAQVGVPLLVLLGLAVAAGIVIDNAGEGPSTPPAAADLTPIRLGERDVADYDPLPGDGRENTDSVPLALDGDRTTSWETERYDTVNFGNIKDGVGLYLDAGRPVIARGLRIITPASDWSVELYVSNTVPQTVADWTRVGGGEVDTERKTFDLDTGSQRFRYYLVWATELPQHPDGGFRAAISELRLLG